MDPKACSLLFFLLACLSATTTSAFNITTILAGYPNFSNFNQLLTQTGLAKLINARSTITVLAVADGAMGSINSKPVDIAKRILSTHVVLDYFDNTKFAKLKRTSILTTLYQTTGIADDQQGFLNVTKTPNGILFGSAAKGAPLNAHLVGTVMNRPYNISIIEVSAVIIAPGIDYTAPMSAPTPKMAPPPGPAQAPEPAEAPEPADAPEPAADAPTPDADAPSPDADAPTPAADAPSPDASDSPASDSPAPKAKSAASPPVSGGATALILGLVAAMGLF